jgi:hypothetical protein
VFSSLVPSATLGRPKAEALTTSLDLLRKENETKLEQMRATVDESCRARWRPGSP